MVGLTDYFEDVEGLAVAFELEEVFLLQRNNLIQFFEGSKLLDFRMRIDNHKSILLILILLLHFSGQPFPVVQIFVNLGLLR